MASIGRHPEIQRPETRAVGDSDGMRQRIADFDWSQTALGPTEAWPDELRTAARLVLDTAFPNILLWGDDLLVCTYNDAYQPLLGTKAEALGQSFLEVWAEARTQIEPALRQALAGQTNCFQEHCFELNRYDRPESAYFDFCFSPVRMHDGTVIGVLNTAVETTGRVRTQQQLRAADQQKDRFLATLSHELRNPLAPLRNSLAIMQQDNPETMEKARAMMTRQVSQLTRLVDDLVDISRINRGKVALRPASVDLATVVQESVGHARAAIDSAGHGLHLALPDEAITLQGDAERLTQVMTNLLDNAIKNTPAGGRIEVALERAGNTAVITVRDNGVGIVADEPDHVFDTFAQIDPPDGRVQEGLGVGLALVRQMVELHGGTAGVRSHGAGEGAEFTVRLPLAADEPETATEEEAAAAGSGALRLLVVDDNPDVADSMQLLLSSLGHEAQVAHDGHQGLEAITAFQPDAIFLDLGLPGIDGMETAQRMRATPAGSNVTLIALTGWGGEDDIRRTTEAGFDHHLVKPVEPNALEQFLAEL